MKEITADQSQVAYCGLYCGACGSYLKGKCPGCAKNEKASWCKVRTCCITNKYGSCADCTLVPDMMDCGKFNNFISKLFALVMRSDRPACIRAIKARGREAFAREMADQKTMTIKR
ncbi:MAG TPA: DUF3795 domain-containing protein [Candidatus Edwardsbacteria bacterium]|nr:DUF3795 domain-containing protein [Candidatus Edwardsbacteria bacterium]